MISDFESRLATVLGAQLPAPFTGTVSVSDSSDAANGSQPRIFVGVYKTQAKPQGFGGNRTIAVPGVSDRMRVMAMKLWIFVRVIHANNADRLQELQGLEQLHYLLDHESFQTGTALSDAGDQGFLIERMSVAEGFSEVPNAPLEENHAGIIIEAEGVFWPIGAPGETGVAIAEIRMRGLALDLELNTELPAFSVGDAPVEITLRLQSHAAHRIGGDDSPLSLNQLALDLQQEDGSPGAGSFSADSPGAGNVQFANITDSRITLTYTPPASAAHDVLIIGFDNGESGLGQELHRFQLISR